METRPQNEVLLRDFQEGIYARCLVTGVLHLNIQDRQFKSIHWSFSQVQNPSFETADMADGNEQGKWVNLDENS